MNASRDVDALLQALDRRLAAGTGAPSDEAPAGYQFDAKGRMVPERLVRDADRLEDQTVRRILAFGVDLADQVARFRAHTFDDLATLLDLLGEQYGRTKTARSGGYSCTSYDGRLKVVVQITDRLTFGPELQTAKAIVDECVVAWSADARPEVVALIQHAFACDKQGRVNREAIFRLRRLQIDDPRWKQAQQAISDSIRIEGAKSHIRLYMRPSPEAKWRAVPINLAADWTDPAYAGARGQQVRAPANGGSPPGAAAEDAS